MKSLIKYLLLATIVIAALFAGAYVTGVLSKPIRYEFLVEGSRWVRIDWGASNCASARDEKFYLVVRVPREGRLCLQDPRPRGWSWTEFLLVDEKGAGTALTYPANTDGLAIRSIAVSNRPNGVVREVILISTKQDAATLSAQEGRVLNEKSEK
jgi:hypothetical protein